MKLAGIGVVFPGGAGVDALRTALEQGVPLQGQVLAKEGVPVLMVPPAALTGNPVLIPARRADRFSKMTLLAATEALAGATAGPDRIGIVLATALGPHGTVFKFVNEMLEFGDPNASPTVFSQSVHAAAASMIATAAKIHGPVLSVADLAFPFEEALTVAEGWLAGGQCDAVLVGAVDELTDVLVHVARRKWTTAADGRLAIGPAGGSAQVPGEGAVFFRLERENGLEVSVGNAVSPAAACLLLNAGALGGNDSDLMPFARGPAPAFTYAALLGSTRIGAAFHLAVAAWMSRAGRIFPRLISLAALGIPDRPAGEWGRGLIQVVSACGTRGKTVSLQA